MKTLSFIPSSSARFIAVFLALILSGEAQAAVIQSANPDLGGWAEKLVAGRPGVPVPETRSLQVGSLVFDPATATRTMMAAHVAGAPAPTIAAATPVALATDADNEVYASYFTSADGSVREFAAQFRPDDARPLYLWASGYLPDVGAGFEEARAALIERVLAGSTDGLRITGLTTPVTEEQLLRTGANAITPPWPRCWVFLVDDHPLGEWEHPCRYVFIAEDLSSFAVQYARAPIGVFAPDGERVLFSVVVAHPVVDDIPAPALSLLFAGTNTPPMAAALNYAGSAQNCYAVIMSGGADRFNNWARYWNNCSQIYSTLRQKYNLPANHITVLMSDGTNAASDRNIGSDTAPVYVNTDPDLDQNGTSDINFACTHANVVNVLNNLRTTLTTNDQLFIYVTDHGYQESGHDAGINLWNWEQLRDDELESLTHNMACSVLIGMGTCYAGGFIDDFSAGAVNRALAVSCRWDETTWVGSTWPNYTQWLYHFTSALRGFYPAAGPVPYHDGSACDADANGDGRVDIHEAWTYATANKPAGNNPQYVDRAAGFGDTAYMNHLHIELNDNSPVSYSQIPKDFSFHVVSTGWAAVGVASASDHDIKADDNRQLTTPYRSSANGGAIRDFVVVNGHRVGNATNYAQVYFGAASAYNVEAEWLPSDAVLGSALSYTASANEVFDLMEANLVAGTSYDVTLHVTSGSPDLGIYVFSAGSDNGSRASANWSRNAGGAGVDETLTFRPSVSGFHGIVMANETGGSGTYSVTVAESAPLAAPASVVATDGGYTDRVRVTWASVALATHYQVYRNTVNVSGSATLVNDWTAGTSFDDLGVATGQTCYYWVKAAATVDGDRESAFSLSNSGYVMPPTLGSDTKVTTTTDPAYYRAGGASVSNRWWAVGVRPNNTSDNWSLRLFDTAGFATQIGSSTYTWPVDLIVVDGNHDGSVYHGVEAYRFSGVGAASVEFEGTDGFAETLAVNTNSTWSWTAGDVVEMFEAPLAAGTYRFTLNITSGVADLDFALFGSGDGDYFRNREQYLARSIDAGAGADESFIYTTATADDFGLCLWANDTNSAIYTLLVERITSGIWQGTVSTNWFTAANWQGGIVPTAVLDATIPAGTPYSPTVAGGTAVCSNLTIASGATLAIGSGSTLTVNLDAHVNGQLRMKYDSALLDITGSMYWHAGSTADISGSWPDIRLDGNLVLESGTSASLTGAHFQFSGGSPSFIRALDEDCVLGWVDNLKNSATYLGLSPVSTEPCRINYLYNGGGHTFTTFSDQEIHIGGYILNSGHLLLDQGTLAFTGNSSTNWPLALTPGDYLNDVALRGSGTLLLSAAFTNTFPILGSVELSGGKLDARLVDLQVGGSWSNFVGTAGFAQGTRKVTFNKPNIKQIIHGTNVFYDLVDARNGSDQLALRGSTTVQHDFAVNFQTAVWGPLDVQGTLVISNTACQLILWGSSDVQATALNLGGDLLVYSGSLTAADLINNGLHGYIKIQGGHVTLTQGTTPGEWFDLYGTLVMTGGRLDLIGGASDHYWPASGTCSFTMNGGILDFQDGGWRIRNGFSGGVTNGTLRCAGNVITETSAFTPVGGLLEMYGPGSHQLKQAAGSSFPSLLVNKDAGSRVEVVTNLTLTGGVDIESGALKAGTNVISLTGSWTNNVGTTGFSEDTSTVRFVGGMAAGIRSDETFHRLELAKTYSAFDALELDGAVTVLNDLALTDGALEMNSGSTLSVGRDVLIADGAGLNANDSAPIEIHVGRHWSNLNTNFSTTFGFDPGYDSLVVFDGGTVSGDMSTAAAMETFNAMRIDRPGGTLRVLDALLVRSDLTILNGSISSGGAYTHRLRGNLTIESGASWYDTSSTVVFDGSLTQNLDHKSLSGWFKHLVVEKNTGIGIAPLLLQSDVLLLGGGTLTVRKGYMDLNGHYVRCTGNVTVEGGGKLLINSGAWLEVGNPGTLEVQGGGLLDVRGTSGSPASVKDWSGAYAFIIRSNAVLRAENAVFDGMNADGLWINDGAVVEEPFTFHGCTFQYGTSGGNLLRLDNSQVMTIRNAVFPSNAGGGASNVRKSNASGRADFVRATGVFAGEAYDNDAGNLVNWHTGAFNQAVLNGPSVATMGGKYEFTATASGDLPMTPITYFWTLTDLSPSTRSHDSLTDTMSSCKWLTPGAKTVHVVVSNACGTVQADLPVDVQELGMEIVGRHWVGTTNAIDAVIRGSSASSSYQIQYRNSLSEGGWSNAVPAGNIDGQDGRTPWTDVGGPGRNVNTNAQIFYRAVLP